MCMKKTKLKGFAAMSKKKRKELARMGGLAVSRDKKHMSEIGRKGGKS